MIIIGYKKLKISAVLFAAIPILFFFIGWLNLPAAAITSVLLIVSVVFFWRNSSNDDGFKNSVSVTYKSLLLIAFISLLWCFMAGLGGFVNQTADHKIRNMIITDMTLKSWPVTYNDGKNLLCYYVAFWTVPTAVGKMVYSISSNATAALMCSNILVLLQSTIGIFITFLCAVLLTQNKKGSRVLMTVLIFIFFSGLDVVASMVIFDTQSDYECWARLYYFQSNTTDLYWIYNQTIPIWPITLCLINEKHMKDFIFLGLLTLPHGPFSLIGIVIFCICKGIATLIEARKNSKIGEEIKNIFSLQSIASILSLVPVFALYYTANVMLRNNRTETNIYSDSYSGFRFHQYIVDSAQYKLYDDLVEAIVLYVLFMIFELLVFAIPLIKLQKGYQKTVTVCVTAFLFVIPLFNMGHGYDFCMKVPVPLLTYICICVSEYLCNNWPQKIKLKSFDDIKKLITKNKAAVYLFVVLYLGSLTSLSCIGNQAVLTIQKIANHETCDMGFNYSVIHTLEEENENGNFFAVNFKESNYYKYFSKKVP